MKNFLVLLFLAMHLSSWSNENTMYFLQRDISGELKTAEQLVNEKKYNEAIEILQGVRSKAALKLNSYMVIMYSNSVKIENAIYLTKKEYTKSSQFLIGCINEFYDNIINDDTLFYGRILSETGELEKVKMYNEALDVYQVFRDKPFKFQMFKYSVDKKITYLNKKVARQNVSNTRSKESQTKTAKSENDISNLVGLLGAFQNGSEASDSDMENAEVNIGEALKTMTDMFGLEEGASLDDLKNVDFSDMNPDFKAMEDFIDRENLDTEQGMGMDSIKYAWNLYKSHDSLLYTKIKSSSEKSLTQKTNQGKTESTSQMMETYNLYSANLLLKNFDEAERNLMEFERMFNKLPPKERGGYSEYTVAISFWSLNMVQQKYEEALKYSFRWLKENKDPKSTVGIIYNIAITYFGMKDYGNAQKWSKKTIDAIKAKNNNRNRNTLRDAEMFYNMSLLANGKFEESLKGFELSSQKENGNLDSKKEQSTWGLLLSPVFGKAVASFKVGQQNKADRYMSEYITSANSRIFESVLGLNPTLAFDENSDKYVSDNIFYFLSQQKTKNGNLTGKGYNTALIFKELLLNKDKTIAENSMTSKKSKEKDLYLKWIDLKEKASDPNTKNRDSLADYVRSYEKILKKQGESSLHNLFDKSKLDWSQIKQQLNDNEAAIEYVSYSPYQFEKNSKETFYGAFIVRGNSEYPEFIPLCNVTDLNSLLETATSQQEKTKNAMGRIYSAANGKKIYELIWKPMENSLLNVNRIFYAPTGMLHNMAFDAVSVTTENKFLGDKYILNRVGSTKNVVEHSGIYDLKKGSLFGDIIYDYTGKVPRPTTVSEKMINERSGEFKHLEGTKNELTELNNLLKINGISATIFSKEKASEENFYTSLKKGQDIVHIATHAFYLKPIGENMLFATDKLGFARIKGDLDPMNRSGLALYGANHFWKSGEKMSVDIEDGILTANELASLDMSMVKLVVLSACETGIGQSLGNEGVFGLQRGLKMAGAQNLLLSLWKVEDLVTKEYMTTFYDLLLTKKLSMDDAYVKTQKQIKQKYPEPYYWASFVLIQ